MQATTVGSLIDRSVGEVILAGATKDTRKGLVGRFLILTEAAFKRPPLVYQGPPIDVPYGSHLVVTDVIQPFGAFYPRLVVALLSSGPHISSSDQFELEHTAHIIA